MSLYRLCSLQLEETGGGLNLILPHMYGLSGLIAHTLAVHICFICIMSVCLRLLQPCVVGSSLLWPGWCCHQTGRAYVEGEDCIWKIHVGEEKRIFLDISWLKVFLMGDPQV